MSREGVTKNELEEFKRELLAEIRLLMRPETDHKANWLRSKDVRKMLNISTGTLLTLRVNGSMKYSKIGSIYYYRKSDILKKLEDSRK
jgi:hypothetical protein